VLLITLAAGFYVGWSIGGNDAANAIGTAVGARILVYRRAIILVALAFIVGGILEGHHVAKTIGEKIVTAPAGSPVHPFLYVTAAAAIALLCAAIWVTISTRLKVPISTSHSIVASVLGAGLAISVFTGVPTVIRWGTITKIVLSWISTPFASIFLAFIFFRLFGWALGRVKEPAKINQIFSVSVVLAGIYFAYSVGANDVGNTVGVVGTVMGGGIGPMLLLFGGVALAFGAITFSSGVIETVGKGITALGPASAFGAQLAAAVTVHIFTQFGIPVSTSHAIVGGVVGVGLVKGTHAIGGRALSLITLFMILTPIVAILLSFGAMWVKITLLGI